MRSSLGPASNAPGSASPTVGGCSGGNSFQPATAQLATLVSIRPPITHRSRFSRSSKTTCGTSSPHLDKGSREVHRSGTSARWLSASKTGMDEVMGLTFGHVVCYFQDNYNTGLD